MFIALDHKDNCKFPVLASPSKMRGVSFLIGSKKFLIAEIDHKNICSDNPLVYNIKNIYELTIYIFLCVSQKYLGIMEEKLRINKMILKTKIQLKFQQFAHISVFQQTTRVFFIANLILVNQLQKKKLNMIVIACKECRRSSSPTLRNGTPLFLRFPHWPHGLLTHITFEI